MLQHVSLFQRLSDQQRAAIEARALNRLFPKGAIIVTEGDVAHSLYVVVSGSVKIYLNDEHGKEILLDVLRAGEHFGELSLLDGEPRSASVAALEATQLLILSADVFQELVLTQADSAAQICRELAQRVRHLTESVRTLALLDVFGRLVKLLNELAVTDAQGQRQVDAGLTQQELANRIGASREMVSRILKDLAVGGYLSIEHRRIILHKKLPSRW